MSRRHVITALGLVSAAVLVLLAGCGGTPHKKSKTTGTEGGKGVGAEATAPAKVVFDLVYNDGKVVPDLQPGLPTGKATRHGSSVSLEFAGLDVANDDANFVTGKGDQQGCFYQAWLRESAHADALSLGVLKVDNQGAGTLTADLAKLEVQPQSETTVLLALEADDGNVAMGPDVVFEGLLPGEGPAGSLSFALPPTEESYDAVVTAQGDSVVLNLTIAPPPPPEGEKAGSDPFVSGAGQPGAPGELPKPTQAPNPVARYALWGWDEQTRKSFALGEGTLQRPAPDKPGTLTITADLGDLTAAQLTWADLDAVYVTFQPAGMSEPGRVRPLVSRIPFGLAYNDGKVDPTRAPNLPEGEASLKGDSLTLKLKNLDPISDPKNFVEGEGDGRGVFYQAWVLDAESKGQTSLGVLPVDPRGTAEKTFDLKALAVKIGDLDTVAVTLEEDDGDAAPNELAAIRGGFPTEATPTQLEFALAPAAADYAGYACVDKSAVTLGLHAPALPGPKAPSLTDPTPHTAKGNQADQGRRGGSYYYEGWVVRAEGEQAVSLGPLALRQAAGGELRARLVADVSVAAAAKNVKLADCDYLMVTLEPPDGNAEPSAHCLLIGYLPGKAPAPQVAKAAKADETSDAAKKPDQAATDKPAEGSTSAAGASDAAKPAAPASDATAQPAATGDQAKPAAGP